MAYQRVKLALEEIIKDIKNKIKEDKLDVDMSKIESSFASTFLSDNVNEAKAKATAYAIMPPEHIDSQIKAYLPFLSDEELYRLKGILDVLAYDLVMEGPI